MLTNFRKVSELDQINWIHVLCLIDLNDRLIHKLCVGWVVVFSMCWVECHILLMIATWFCTNHCTSRSRLLECHLTPEPVD